MSVCVCAEFAAKAALVGPPEPVAAVSISRGLLPVRLHRRTDQPDVATLARSLGLFAILTLGYAGHSAYALDLYDAARDKQAQDAKAAAAAIDTTAVINAMQANHKALLASELSAQDGYAATRRNLVLRELLGTNLSEPKTQLGLLDVVEAEEELLIGASDPRLPPGPGAADPITRAMNALDTWTQKMQVYQRDLKAWTPDFNKLGLGDPSCDGIGVDGAPPPPVFQRQMKAGGVINPVDVTKVLKGFRDFCKDQPTEVFDASHYGGAWAQAYKQYEAAAKTLTAVKAQAVLEQITYQDALKAYDKAVSDNTAASTPEAQNAVDNAAAKLTEVVNAIGAGQNAFATQFIAQEKLTSLQNFIAAVMQGEDAATAPAAAASAAAPAAAASAAAGPAKATPAPAAGAASAPTQSKAAMLVVGLSKLNDDTRKALAQAKIPLNVPLMLARDQEQLKLSAATVDVTAWQTQLDLSKQLLTTIADELRQLWLAHHELTFESKDADGNAKGKADTEGSSIHMRRLADMRYDSALKEATPAERNYLLTATVRYLDAVNRYSAQRDKLEYRRIAAGYDRSLAYSAVNVQRWQSLINVTTDQVADFYAAGFKPETISNMVQAAILLWIGHGVNK